MNTKQLTIQINTEEVEEYDDIYSPASSPPPPHLIYIPENYRSSNNNAGIKPWQQNYKLPVKEEKKKKDALIIIRRHFYLFAKKFLKMLLSNNNLLLIVNVVNKLWKARANFIQPLTFVIKNTLFIIKHDGYLNLMRYTISFIKDIFMKQQQQLHINSTVNKFNSSKSPLTTFRLLFGTVSHLFIVSQKITSRWLSHTIKNMGGLDSIILAISAIAFAKTIQKSERIF